MKNSPAQTKQYHDAKPLKGTTTPGLYSDFDIDKVGMHLLGGLYQMYTS